MRENYTDVRTVSKNASLGKEPASFSVPATTVESDTRKVLEIASDLKYGSEEKDCNKEALVPEVVNVGPDAPVDNGTDNEVVTDRNVEMQDAAAGVSISHCSGLPPSLVVSSGRKEPKKQKKNVKFLNVEDGKEVEEEELKDEEEPERKESVIPGTAAAASRSSRSHHATDSAPPSFLLSLPLFAPGDEQFNEKFNKEMHKAFGYLGQLNAVPDRAVTA
jgi:hypothetical protein